MKVKEIEDFVDIIAYESKDDNFFIEKKRQGFDMKLSFQEMFQKADADGLSSKPGSSSPCCSVISRGGNSVPKFPDL